MTDPAASPKGKVPVFWVIWFSILVGLVIIYLQLGRGPRRLEPNPVTDYIGLMPLLVSSLLRWWIMPRITKLKAALVALIVGVALAEACGLIGIFLSQYREALFILGLLGILQWMPLFVSRLEEGNTLRQPR